jgi:hypothetical protein
VPSGPSGRSAPAENIVEPFAPGGVPCPHDRTRNDAEEASAAMYSVFYIIGVVVVVLAVLSLLGLN